MEKSTATAPYPIKEGEQITGVGIPIIDKAIYFKDCPDRRMEWDEAMEHAKSIGRELPTKRELYILAYFKDAINAIAELAGVEGFLSDWVWSGTENGSYYAWYVSFGTGNVVNNNKHIALAVRPVAAL